MTEAAFRAQALFHLLEFSDGAFPVGSFSFSNGLETAAHLGIVSDAESLKSYTISVATQAAFSDGVAALLAYRAINNGDYQGFCEADRQIMLFRLNEEARLMLARMGKKLAELGKRLFPESGLFQRWLEDINNGTTPGSYPAAQGLVFALAKLDEKALFISHQYGVINMILSAALRCLRVSHYDTQRIMFDMAFHVEDAYEKAKNMGFENMNAFAPQMDIFASLHEKGRMRMFMN